MATDKAKQKKPAPKKAKKSNGPKGRTWNGKKVTRWEFRVYQKHAAGKQVRVPDGKYCNSCGRVAGRVHLKNCADPCDLLEY